MLSIVSYRLPQHGGVANAYRPPGIRPPAHSRILCPSTGSTILNPAFTISLIATCARSRVNGIMYACCCLFRVASMCILISGFQVGVQSPTPVIVANS